MRGAGHHSYFAHLQVAVSEEGKCRFSSYINNVPENESNLVSLLERLLDKSSLNDFLGVFISNS